MEGGTRRPRGEVPVSRFRSTGIALILGGILGVLFLTPLAMVVSGGFFDEGRFTLRYLLGVFRNPVYAEGLLNSLRIALGTFTLSSAIALPLAWLTHRYDFAGKKLLSGLLLVPMILPPFVGAIGFQRILGTHGVLNAVLHLGPVDWLGQSRLAAVMVLQALGLYPILYLNVTAALANVDPAMEEAAENLGCSGLRKFFRITFPLILPGFFAGAAIVFIWSFTELGTPLMLNVSDCAPVQVYDALKEVGANPFPYALVFVMLAASVALYTAVRLVFGRKAYAMQSKAATGSAAIPLRGGRAFRVACPFLGVILLALAPHLGVILTSLAEPGSWYATALPERFTGDHYLQALSHDMTLSGIRNSLIYATLAVLLNAALGIGVAWISVRSRVPGRGALDALSMLPLAVPGLVMAFGYLALSARLIHLEGVKENPFLMSLFDVRTNPTFFLVIAYSVRRLPYMVRSAVAGLQQTSVTLEEAAANLGASQGTSLRRITLPLISANLIAGGLLAFAFSLLEVSDSLMLAQRMDHYPITKTIYELFQLIGTGEYLASALGVWAMAFLTITILGCSLLLGRRMGALFRM
jgi:iron(III) transport system permease protein